jgi:hypothetical protein
VIFGYLVTSLTGQEVEIQNLLKIVLYIDPEFCSLRPVLCEMLREVEDTNGNGFGDMYDLFPLADSPPTGNGDLLVTLFEFRQWIFAVRSSTQQLTPVELQAIQVTVESGGPADLFDFVDETGAFDDNIVEGTDTSGQNCRTESAATSGGAIEWEFCDE